LFGGSEFIGPDVLFKAATASALKTVVILTGAAVEG